MAFLQEYEKLRLIGKGSFATIWKVRHANLGYIRAVKVSNEMVDDENDKSYQTFLDECRVLLKIGNGGHPNIVRIYQPRLIDNKAIVEMDYVEGCTLNEYIQKQRFLPYSEIEKFIHDIVGALAYCHVDIYKFLLNPAEDDLQRDPNDGTKFVIDKQKEQELIRKYRVTHNDLHSNNIMRRDYDGNFILLDFGLSIQDNHCVKSSSRRDGALEYSASEKWNNGVITPQTDVYSLGVLLYEALAGRVPFPLEIDKYSNDIECKNRLYHSHLEQEPPAIEPLRKKVFHEKCPNEKWERDYPEWLEAIIRKCLAKQPQDRYQDAKAVWNDFHRHLSEDQSSLFGIREKELKDLQETIAELTKHIAALEYERTQLSDNNADKYLDDIERLQDKIKTLEKEKEQLNERIDAVKREQTPTSEQPQAVELTRKIAELRQENTQLSKKQKLRWILPTLLTMLALGIGVWGYWCYGVSSYYQRGFFGLQDRLVNLYGDTCYFDEDSNKIVSYDSTLVVITSTDTVNTDASNNREETMAKLRTENAQLKIQLATRPTTVTQTETVVKADPNQTRQINSLQSQIQTLKNNESRLQKENQELKAKINRYWESVLEN